MEIFLFNLNSKEELDCDIKALKVFNDNTHDYGNFIAIKCTFVGGVHIASEHSKLIWLNRENLDSLKWAPADVPAVKQLVEEI
ncbi:hypothetical protein [Paraclostridium sordellii]|uniref:hypothetical protein n=1 Tax=Paraclostridium sordellii TaxID=1505 RepID=UPI0006DC70FA|nr:hypothetical protein [Paeniclostridium sordellii]